MLYIHASKSTHENSHENKQTTLQHLNRSVELHGHSHKVISLVINEQPASSGFDKSPFPVNKMFKNVDFKNQIHELYPMLPFGMTTVKEKRFSKRN